MLREELFWQDGQESEVVEALLLRSGIPLAGTAVPRFEIDGARRRIRRAAEIMGCDSEVTNHSTGSLLREVATARGPCIIGINQSGVRKLLAVVFDSSTHARIVRADGLEENVRRRYVLDIVASARPVPSVHAIFEGLPGGAAASRALSKVIVDDPDCILASFGPDAASPFVRQLHYRHHFRVLSAHVGLLALQGVVALIALWTLGSSAVDGRVNFGMLLAWMLLALSDIPLQYMSTRALLRFSIGAADRLKRRLLEGTFAIDEHDIRTQGFGSLVARTNEAAIVERIDLLDVFGVFASIAQFVLAIALFERGTMFQSLIAVLVLACAALVIVGLWFYRAYAKAYDLRLGLTDALTDNIIGHRTRAVQQVPSEYHKDDDAALAAYQTTAQTTDFARALLSVLPRLWLLAAGVVVYISFVTWGPTTPLAWAAIGIALVYQAFENIARSLDRIIIWLTAVRGIRPLIGAGLLRGSPPRRTDLDLDEGAFPVVLSATSVSFGYRAGAAPILSNATLQVRSGERVLLEGPSGGGKTTLFKLIAGELRPTGGIVLVGGTDVHSVSDDEWRRRVASAPQFHENYVFAQTVAFNLDPNHDPRFPSEEAEAICAELGLDEVIARMPQGYQQLLGETGWQLSHGERSRLYIARALLQHADLLLFDESFGALDPETQLRTLECVRRRAKTLMVIAHV